MSTSPRNHRSSSHSGSHSTCSSQDKQTNCERSTYYSLRSRSCSRSHRSKDSKEYRRNHNCGRNLNRDRRQVRRTSNSRNSRFRSRSRTFSYSKSLSPGDRQRGYHHRHGRSRSHTPSHRSYWSSRSRSRGSYYSIGGCHSSRPYHRRNRYWSRSYSIDRDRFYNRVPGFYHPPYPPYSGRGAPLHPIEMIPMHPENDNHRYRGYSNPHGTYDAGHGAQYGGAGSYHSRHSDAPPHGAGTHRDYGGGRSNDRDEGPPQLHKRRHDGPPGVSLLIRHISPTISTQNLFQVFTQKLPHLPPPRDIYIPRDFHSHQPKGFAFVEYTSFEQAQEARSEMDKMVMHGKEIEVVFAQDKRKTPSQMRDRHLDDAYGGVDISKFSHEHESSSSFERHKGKERQK